MNFHELAKKNIIFNYALLKNFVELILRNKF